jgi:hypothetical protein
MKCVAEDWFMCILLLLYGFQNFRTGKHLAWQLKINDNVSTAELM